jgi:large subunit ribosomal protein L25
MEQIELRAETRTVFGRKVGGLRKSGLVPATLYGPRTEPLSLQVSERELDRVLSRAGTNRLVSVWIDDAKKPRMTLARDVQIDPTSHSILHFDLYQVVMTEKITADIPLTFVGEAPAVAKKAGLLVRSLDSIQVHCLPDHLGETIEVDVSVLEDKDQSILVGDLQASDDIEILTSPEEVVVIVLPLREIEEPVVEEELELAEVEVISEAEEVEEEPREPTEEGEPTKTEEHEGESE